MILTGFFRAFIIAICISIPGIFCRNNGADKPEKTTQVRQSDIQSRHLNKNNRVGDIVAHTAFGEFGRLLLPHDDNTRYYHVPLRNVASLMPYHSRVKPDDVLAALNDMIDEVGEGNKIFYDYYTEDQKRQNPDKKNTGLFFFRGKPGAPMAIICPGGGFSYVGSLHEGFPLARELSKKGYNAFVIRYRIGSGRWATEDLAAAISYLFRQARDLQVDTGGYSLWGGSAGARMVGDIARDGVSAYGGDNLPKPAAAVIAYTGQAAYSNDFSPAFITVAANDPIVDIRTVERRVANLKGAGVDVEYKRYEHAGHGFGLGTGTEAEGWLDLATRFWERQLER